MFAEQLDAFSAAQDGKVRVQVERKARYGKGGLLDFLRSAQPVASSVLPDLVALDVVELEKAVEAGVVQPLDRLLDDEVTARLYPFAREAGQFGGSALCRAVPERRRSCGLSALAGGGTA